MSGIKYVCRRCGDEFLWENVPDGEDPSETRYELCNSCQREVDQSQHDVDEHGRDREP